MLEAAQETAGDVMSRDVAVVTPETPLRLLLRLMAERRIGGLPVVDADGRLLGMVSAGDVLRWHDGLEARQEERLERLAEGLELPADFVGWIQAQHETVRAVMPDRPTITVTEDTPVRRIEELFIAHNIKRVPVVRGSRLVGMVTRADLIRLLARILSRRAAEQAPARPGDRPSPP